jgi:hypothetical protein
VILQGLPVIGSITVPVIVMTFPAVSHLPVMLMTPVDEVSIQFIQYFFATLS